MKIDECSINHNALRLIKEAISEPIEYDDENPTLDHTRILTLGEIHGILMMADTMKEVLQG